MENPIKCKSFFVQYDHLEKKLSIRFPQGRYYNAFSQLPNLTMSVLGYDATGNPYLDDLVLKLEKNNNEQQFNYSTKYTFEKDRIDDPIIIFYNAGDNIINKILNLFNDGVADIDLVYKNLGQYLFIGEKNLEPMTFLWDPISSYISGRCFPLPVFSKKNKNGISQLMKTFSTRIWSIPISPRSAEILDNSDLNSDPSPRMKNFKPFSSFH